MKPEVKHRRFRKGTKSICIQTATLRFQIRFYERTNWIILLSMNTAE